MTGPQEALLTTVPLVLATSPAALRNSPACSASAASKFANGRWVGLKPLGHNERSRCDEACQHQSMAWQQCNEIHMVTFERSLRDVICVYPAYRGLKPTATVNRRDATRLASTNQWRGSNVTRLTWLRLNGRYATMFFSSHPHRGLKPTATLNRRDATGLPAPYIHVAQRLHGIVIAAFNGGDIPCVHAIPIHVA